VHGIMQIHEKFGLAVFSLAVVLSLWRILNRSVFSRWGRFVHILLAFAMVGALVKGADLGGLMVYKYGVASQVGEQSPDHRHGEGDEPAHHDEQAQDHADDFDAEEE
jgi:cytochrome b561